MKNYQEQRQNRRKAAGMLFIAAFLVLLCCLGAFVMQMLSSKRDRAGYEELQQEVVSEVETVQVKTPAEAEEPDREPAWYDDYASPADKSIDFDSLKARNEAVYAWISVPGTEVEYPVVHTEIKNDITYLSHDIDLEVSKAGTVYSDGFNSGDLSDRFTLLYGHNMKDGTMFAGLHAFRDSSFFESHDSILIYLPDGQMLTYRIFAAHTVGDNHILAESNFADDQVFLDYVDSLQDTRDMSAHFRDVPVTAGDRILTLCTCIGDDNKRFFVQGVLQKNGNDE